jgi:hypothetical protein
MVDSLPDSETKALLMFLSEAARHVASTPDLQDFLERLQGLGQFELPAPPSLLLPDLPFNESGYELPVFDFSLPIPSATFDASAFSVAATQDTVDFTLTADSRASEVGPCLALDTVSEAKLESSLESSVQIEVARNNEFAESIDIEVG